MTITVAFKDNESVLSAIKAAEDDNKSLAVYCVRFLQVITLGIACLYGSGLPA